MLQNLLSTEILVVDSISVDEATYLVKQLEVSKLALGRFLNNEISFSDYCEILELCGVNIDGYLLNVEENLQQIGLAV